MKKYEWAIIGSGIAGISIAEMLTRQGHSVILIEKNKKLASETTREFHEWLHTGSLYTLIPDRLITLRFILGAIDDLLEYYSSYERMNLISTRSGLRIDSSQIGWFNNNFIHFKYKVKGRKITFPWIYGVARSIFLIEKIKKHDWLRRRAGELGEIKSGMLKGISVLMTEILKHKEYFKDVQTSDFTINSRILLKDMISTSLDNGLDYSLNNEIINIEHNDSYKMLSGSNENFMAEKVALCNGAGIKKFADVKSKISYAPIAVVSEVPNKTKSFVELDYFPKNCINLLTKENNFGLAGGISVSEKSKCDEYLDYVLRMLKKEVPSIKEVERYIGIKNEITFKNQPRGYLYHIINSKKGIWSIVPGKFSLAFSMAPEFYRQVYNKNPKKFFKTTSNDKKLNQIVSNTVWFDSYKKFEANNGNN